MAASQLNDDISRSAGVFARSGCALVRVSHDKGMFSRHKITFFDVRINNPNAPSYKAPSLADVYKKNGNGKMRSYSDKILQVEMDCLFAWPCVQRLRV